MDKSIFLLGMALGAVMGWTLWVLGTDLVTGTADGWNMLQVLWLVWAGIVAYKQYSRLP